MRPFEGLNRQPTSDGTRLDNLLTVFEDDLLFRRLQDTRNDVEIVLAHEMKGEA